MALYEFRCRTCDRRFEVRRAMSDADTMATCPDGHDDTVRLLSTFAAPGITSARAPSAVASGCCGGGCGCAN